MIKNVKREDFNVLVLGEDGTGGKGPKPNGVEPFEMPSSDSKSDDEEEDKPEGGEGKPDGEDDESSGGKPGSGKGDSGGGSDSDDIIPPGRGPGGMLTKEESDRLLEQAGLEPRDEVDPKKLVNEANRIAESVHSARRTAGSGGGGSLRKKLADLDKSQVDWRAALKRFIGTAMSQMEEYFGNRKFIGGGEYYYGDRQAYTGLNSAAVAIDVSGSVAGDKDFKTFVSEVAAMAKAKKINEVHILPFAEKVKDDFIIKNREPKLSDFDNVRRGGGTEAIPHVINYINKIKSGLPAFVVIITDGYLTSGLPQPPRWGKRCIWLIYGNPTFEKDYGFDARWGKVVHCDFSDENNGKGWKF